MIGQLCGKYRLIESIGRGGVGEVFRAEHDITGEPAAVKVFAEQIGEDADALREVFERARAVTRLGHPSISRVLDYGNTESGAAYIAMELLEGERLHDRLTRTTEVGIAKSLGFAINIAEALSAAHAVDVTHGDLKPSNIFITSDPESPLGERVLLLDFGVSRLIGRGATGEVDLGTAGFMAPERCRGNEIGAPADVYALGCLIFRMLSGRSAIDGTRAGGFTVAHINQTPPPLGELTSAAPMTLSELVAAMLEKAPEDRPSAEEVASKLARVVDLVEARVTADAAVAKLGDAETAIAPAGPLYGEEEATVLDSGMLSKRATDRDEPTVSPDELEDPDDAADEDIEVDSLAPKRRQPDPLVPLKESPTYNELGANTVDIEDLPAPVGADDDGIEDLPAPVAASRDKLENLPAPVRGPRGKPPPPDPLVDSPTQEDLNDADDPLEEVLGLPAPVTFRKPSGGDDAEAGPLGELARVKHGDKGAAPEVRGGDLALLGGDDDDRAGRGELGAVLPASSRKSVASKKAEEGDGEAKPGVGKRKRGPHQPANPSDPALLNMIDDLVTGDDAPTMIVPLAIDALALEKEEEEKKREKKEVLPPRPRRAISGPGGTSLPDMRDDDEPKFWHAIPAEWIRWGAIGAGILAVLVIFLIARSCDDAPAADEPVTDAPAAPIDPS